MDWINVLEIFGVIGGVATIFGVLLAPMFWLGSKIDAVSHELNNKIDAVSQELNNKIDTFKTEMHAEMKDFHGRLCAIEERRVK